MNLAPPRGKTGCGIVVDDFVSYSIDARDPAQVATSPTTASRLADQAERAYKRENLIPRADKAERDSLRAQVWGCMIDGEAGLIRGSLKRAAPLLNVINAVLEIGAVTGGILEIIVGGLISLFIFRRRLLSLLNEVFGAMQARDRDEAFRLGAELREELVLCAGLLPLAVVELRATYSKDIHAVDASNVARSWSVVRGRKQVHSRAKPTLPSQRYMDKTTGACCRPGEAAWRTRPPGGVARRS